MFPHESRTLNILLREKVEACIFLNHLVPDLLAGAWTHHMDAFLSRFLCLLPITWITGVARHQQDFPWLFITMFE